MQGQQELTWGAGVPREEAGGHTHGTDPWLDLIEMPVGNETAEGIRVCAHGLRETETMQVPQ